jgi:AraC-like DNA-binding protein
MDFFDAIIRFAAVGQLALIAALACLQPRRSVTSVLVALNALSFAAVLINSSAFEMPHAFRALLQVMEAPNTALMWLLGLAVFRDDFAMKPGHWLVLAGVWLHGLAIRFYGFETLLPPRDQLLMLAYGTYFAMMAHLLWRVASDAGEDLLKQRRQARLVVVIAFVTLSALMLILEMTLPHATQSFVRALFALILASAAGLWLMRFNAHRLGFSEAPGRQAAPAPNAPAESPLGQRLSELMDRERVYLEPNLTVKALADRMGFAEHRVRAYINQKTGFRNFSSFINSRRIADAKQRLADPKLARQGILPIALDVGFASLTTFNRAFKTIEGETPSEFRARALGEPRGAD